MDDVMKLVAADAQNYLPHGVDSRNCYIAFGGLWKPGTSFVLFSSSQVDPVDSSLLIWPCLFIGT